MDALNCRIRTLAEYHCDFTGLPIDTALTTRVYHLLNPCSSGRCPKQSIQRWLTVRLQTARNNGAGGTWKKYQLKGLTGDARDTDGHRIFRGMRIRTPVDQHDAVAQPHPPIDGDPPACPTGTAAPLLPLLAQFPVPAVSAPSGNCALSDDCVTLYLTAEVSRRLTPRKGRRAEVLACTEGDWPDIVRRMADCYTNRRSGLDWTCLASRYPESVVAFSYDDTGTPAAAATFVVVARRPFGTPRSGRHVTLALEDALPDIAELTRVLFFTVALAAPTCGGAAKELVQTVSEVVCTLDHDIHGTAIQAVEGNTALAVHYQKAWGFTEAFSEPNPFLVRRRTAILSGFHPVVSIGGSSPCTLAPRPTTARTAIPGSVELESWLRDRFRHVTTPQPAARKRKRAPATTTAGS